MSQWQVKVGVFVGLLAAGTLTAVDRASSAPPPAHDRHLGGPASMPRPAAEAGWDADSAGVAAGIHEIIRTRVDGLDVVAYRVTVTGFAAGQRMQVWMRRQSGVVQFLADDVTANLDGMLVSQADSTEAFFVLAADYAPGESFDLAVLNADRTVRAFARAVPFPAAAQAPATGSTPGPASAPEVPGEPHPGSPGPASSPASAWDVEAALPEPTPGQVFTEPF
jgi:hypothetical protein